MSTTEHAVTGDLVVAYEIEPSYTTSEAVLTAVSLASTIPDDPVLDDVVDTDALDRIFSQGRDGGTLLFDLWGMSIVVDSDEVRVYNSD